MGNQDRIRRVRSKKRKFTKNQFKTVLLNTTAAEGAASSSQEAPTTTTTEESCSVTTAASTTPQSKDAAQRLPTDGISASSKKLRRSLDEIASTKPSNNFNIIMNTSMLDELIAIVGLCPLCFSKITLAHDKKFGFCQSFILKCSSCSWTDSILSSSRCQTVQTKKSKNSFDINVRSILAFREIGVGHAGIETYCSLMNMPPPMAYNAYSKTVSKLHNAYGFCAPHQHTTRNF